MADDIVDVGTGGSKKDAVGTALVIFTTLALLVGFILFEKAFGDYYGGGLFK